MLGYLKGNDGNVSETARVFGVNRPVIYDIQRKQREGNLRDRSRAPHNHPRRTPPEVETKVVEVKNKTRLGPQRLSVYLSKHEGLSIPAATIRHVLRRNRHRLTRAPRQAHSHKEKREFVDWYSAKPFEIVQVDLKHIRDHKALTHEQIIHLDAHDIPNYQWSALDVTSRFKLIGYSREKTWTNGLCWYLWVISWLRSHGVKTQILFTVDNGEEFGGKSWFKVAELRKLIAGFGCRLTQNHKGHPEENAHLERSHRTDDDEFYIPRAMSITSDATLLDQAQGYIYYYNNVREHSSLENLTPFEWLKDHAPDIHDNIRCVQPILLDSASVQLGPWSGYNVLTQHPTVRRKSSVLRELSFRAGREICF